MSKWQREFNQIPCFKAKTEIEQWKTSFHKNRRHEIIFARLRLNCIKEFHLLPRIENSYPLRCTCDGSRQSLQHLFFDCGFYVNQRQILLDRLYKDKKPLVIKSLLENNLEYCELVIKFLENIRFISKI